MSILGRGKPIIKKKKPANYVLFAGFYKQSQTAARRTSGAFFAEILAIRSSSSLLENSMSLYPCKTCLVYSADGLQMGKWGFMM